MATLKRLLGVALLLSLTSLMGNTIPWKQKSTFQFAQDVALTDLLRGFSALQGISTVIDPDIKGTVNGKFADISPEDFLDRVSRAYGLVWFYDGNILYMYPAQKTESKFIEINDLAAVKLLETVSNLGMIAPTSSIRLLGTGGIAFVSGPPRYVEIVSDIASRLSKNLRINFSTAPKIKIFPLKYAWAYDTTFNSQESAITIPGVATVLRGLMDTGTNVSPDVIVSGQRMGAERPPLLARKTRTFKDKVGPEKYKSETETSKKAKEDRKKEEQEAAEEETEASLVFGATMIQPDMRLNAIIVRDVEEKMPQYEEVIKALDVPVQIIEIAVTIFNVRTNASKESGLKFFNYTPEGHTDRNFNIAPGGVEDSLTQTNAINALTNISGSAVVNGATILSQVRLLASDGHANVLSRPSVVTLNNIEAEISSTESVFLELRGVDSSDLANVSASQKLRVTPRVIEHKDHHVNKIKLLISIDDGNLSTTTTNPQTTNSFIQTQAVINEGQSLLVGGIYQQTEEDSESGVPILKNIPILGHLFKSKTKNSVTNERMFLITPRIIDLAYETGPDIAPNLKDFKKPTHGIAGKMSARNFRIRHRNKIHGRGRPDPKHHSPYHFGYNPHPKRPHYFSGSHSHGGRYGHSQGQYSSDSDYCCEEHDQDVCVNE